MKVEVQATTTENADARSSNQTLSDVNWRKALDLDTAYAEWAPNANWKLTLGKMKYPWVRVGSYLDDGDVNPEGVAASWQQGATGLFGGAWISRLSERSTLADSSLFGAQVGWRGTFGDGGKYTLAAGYFDHGAAEGYSVIQSEVPAVSATRPPPTRRSAAAANRPASRTTTTSSRCWARSRSRSVRSPYAVRHVNNGAADYSFASTSTALNIPKGLDTAYSAGFTYGKAGNPGTWEFGYVFQKVEKDALFSQWVDSDFAAGATDGDGHAIKFAYAFARATGAST